MGIFIRVYFGLLVALVAVLTICVFALHIVNTVRFAQYNEDLVSGTMYLMMQKLDRDPQSVQSLSKLFDADIQYATSDQVDIGEYDMLRLDRGHVLVSTSEVGRTADVIKKLPDGQLLDIKLGSITDTQAQATVKLLLDEWQYSGQSIDVFLPRLQNYFGFPLNLVRQSEVRLSQNEIGRLVKGNTLIRIAITNDMAEAYAMIPGETELLKLGPIENFEAYPWQALVVIAVMGILLIGLGVYWVVNHFEVRLRKLEQATSRLAKGHLSTRVAMVGRDPVARLGVSFNKLAEHIQRLISIQREMIRAVSHELRTPVARIRFGAQIIEDSVMDDPFVIKQVRGMDADIQELDELIDEILTYARLEEGGPLLDFQQINIADLAVQVVEEARPPEHVKVEYHGTDPETVLKADAESRYIHRAIQNLVGNAGRYATSRVYVYCSIDEDTCRVDVDDDGPGIPEEDWERVFTAFARLDDSRTRASGGYGLGLSIVRRIAYWHGGRAMVSRSEELGGAKFSLIWPRYHEQD